MKLTGSERWVLAGLSGALVWARSWGREDIWWPVVHVELDCGLITIDVCGLPEIWDLGNCAKLRIESDDIIDNENIWDTATERGKELA